MAAPEGEPVPQTPDKFSTAGIDALLDEMGAGDPLARPLALDELRAMGLDVPGPRTRLPRATRVGGSVARLSIGVAGTEAEAQLSLADDPDES